MRYCGPNLSLYTNLSKYQKDDIVNIIWNMNVHCVYMGEYYN